MNNKDFAIITPLANEENDFIDFIDHLKIVLNRIGSGTIYFVVDPIYLEG